MQINDDGGHAILLVATHCTCKVDHAGVPVMWLRHADGKLRRDGIRAALLQRPCPVDERGRVTAHRNSSFSKSLAFWRTSGGLVVKEKESGNG